MCKSQLRLCQLWCLRSSINEYSPFYSILNLPRHQSYRKCIDLLINVIRHKIAMLRGVNADLAFIQQYMMGLYIELLMAIQ